MQRTLLRRWQKNSVPSESWCIVCWVSCGGKLGSSGAIDAIETRHHRKSILFMGVPVEDSSKISLYNMQNKLQLKDQFADSFTICHRLGASNNEHNRPVLARFHSTELRTSVWRMKTTLKGSAISCESS